MAGPRRSRPLWPSSRAQMPASSRAFHSTLTEEQRRDRQGWSLFYRPEPVAGHSAVLVHFHAPPSSTDSPLTGECLVMNIAELVVAIERNAVPFVFVNVLLEQLGVPLPALPTLLLAGSLAATP